MKKKTSAFFRGMASIFLALSVIAVTATGVASSWEGKVNELLGTETATIERSLDEKDYPFKSDYASAEDLVKAEIAYVTRLQAEGTVSLKGTPVVDGEKVTLFGMRSGDKMQFGGSMGELIDASNIVTLAQALEDRGFSVNPDFVQFYKDMEADHAPQKTPGGNVVDDYEEQGAQINEVPISMYDAGKIGDYKDAAVIVLGRDAGESCCFYPGEKGMWEPEEFSQSPTGNVFSLTNDERDLVNWVKEQGFNKIIVMINAGTSMEIDELKQDDAIDSIMWIGTPGAYGTYGLADLLKGTTLPSGHLPDTFAVNSALSPAAQNVGIYVFDNADDIDTTNNNGQRSRWYLAELEGIYVGYKYYESRYFDSVLGQGNAAQADARQSVNGSSWDYDSEVSYPFGYGLEGSTFEEEITDVDIDWSGEKESRISVKVTNTGDAAAKHAVQLYVSLPYTDMDRGHGIEKSAIQLIGYAKTGENKENTFEEVKLIEPGAHDNVEITFNVQDFYSYDKAYSHDGVEGAWMIEAGDYYFATGNGAHDAANAVLREMGQDVETTGAVVVEALDADKYVTESNDTTIMNRMEKADLNNTGAAEVTYLSRNDWFGTFPKELESLAATDEMITELRNATYDMAKELETYDGPESFTYGADNGIRAVQLRGKDYDDEMFEQALDQMELEDLINQYIAYFEEIESLAMPIESRADSPLGLIATIGQRTKGTIYEVAENSEVYGKHTDIYPGGPVLAATVSPLLQSEYGRLIGNDALWTGYNTWFGPGMNLHRSPFNGRNVGYYSEDSVLTGRVGGYVNKKLNEYGVVTNVKHFAFNDQETNRDGLAVFLDEQAARENELRGFQIGIREGNISGLMSAFNRIGCVHVAASKDLMNGILRGEWGWNGFMMTDSVKSSAYFLPRETAVAGNDQMLGGSNNAKVWNLTKAEVEKDIVLQSCLRESYHRKLYAYANCALLNGIDENASAGKGQVWWKTLMQVVSVGACIGFLAFGFLFVKNERKERRQ